MKWKGWILILLTLFFIGCSSSRAPEKPKISSAKDLPNDDGKGIVLSWIHFNASPLEKYEIYRGTSPDNMKVVGSKTYQIAPDTSTIDSSNIISGKEYYLIVTDGNPTPIIDIVEGKPDNPDAEKITMIETKVILGNAGKLNDKYADGKFYKIKASDDLIKKSSIVELKGYDLKGSGDSLFIGKDDKIIKLTTQKSQREIEYLKKAKIIESVDTQNEDIQKEYGTRITAFVTEKGNRYSMIWLSDKYVDTDTLIEPNTKYYYKVRASFGYRKYVDSDTITVTAIDNKPNPPQLVSAIYDTNMKEGVINWDSQDSDIDKVKIVRVIDSTKTENIGIVSGAFGGSGYKLKNLKSAELKSKFKLIATDKANQSTSSDTFSIVLATLPKEPKLPQNIFAKDMPNDNSTSLVVGWGTPQISLSYSCLNIIPAPEFKEFNDVNGLLIGSEQNGAYPIRKPDTTYSKTFQTIISAEIANSPLPKEPYDILILYDKEINQNDKIGFVQLQLDNGKTITDFTDDGRYVFKGISKGKHTITAWILKPSGKKIEESKSVLELNLPDELEGGQESPSVYCEIYRGKDNNPDNFDKVITLPLSIHEYPDKLGIKAVHDTYYYFVRAYNPEGNFKDSEVFGPVKPKNNLFHKGRTSVLVMLLIFIAIAIYFLLHAQRGKTFFVRPIAGISHVDEALGRATEMGRPILYVLGLDGIPSVNTLAGITILGRVARKAAEYQLKVIVPAYDPLTMLVAQETVRSAFTDAGRPDLFNENDVFFVTDSQFAYAAAVSGIMIREKTATNFYMGGFYAESMLLTEAGASTGAIQIAGSDAMTQLPFFITTCDYTLIGEELYAASAYLSNDPAQIASLKIQDLNKLVIMIIMLAGIIMISFGWHWLYNFFLVQIQ